MPTQITPRLGLPYWQKGDRDWHVQYAEACALLDAIATLGCLRVRATEDPSTTLNIAVSAGPFAKSDGTIFLYAGTASQTLTASTTNYLYLTDSGVLTVNTTGWPAATFHIRLATVITDAATVTAITDERIAFSSIGKDLGSRYLPLTGGTLVDAGGVITIGLGSTYGTKLGATGDKLGFLGANPIAQQANTVDLVTLLTNLGLRAAGGNPSLNLGTGTITCGAFNVGGLVTIADGQNIATGTGTGTKIGTSTLQKLAFWNAAPIAQPANTVDLVTLLTSLGLRATGGNPSLNLGTGAITCGVLNVGGLTTVADGQNIATGIGTGTKLGTAPTQKLSLWGVNPVVQPAAAAQAAITNSTGGTPGSSLTAVAATNTGDVSATINNNLATLWTLLDAIRTALVNLGAMKGSA